MKHPENRFPLNMSPDDIQYANNEAEEAWTVTAQVEKLNSEMPEEGLEVNSEPISFDPTHLNKGFHAIFTAGTVVVSDDEGTYLVPERTLGILDKLGIPYQRKA